MRFVWPCVSLIQPRIRRTGHNRCNQGLLSWLSRGCESPLLNSFRIQWFLTLDLISFIRPLSTFRLNRQAWAKVYCLFIAFSISALVIPAAKINIIARSIHSSITQALKPSPARLANINPAINNISSMILIVISPLFSPSSGAGCSYLS